MTFALLRAHAPSSLVALGDAGDRTAADLMRDARAIAATLPAASPRSEVLVVCGDRYAFAACVIAAWSRGHAVALPPNLLERSADDLSALPNVCDVLHDGDAPRGTCVRSILASPSAEGGAVAPPPIAPDRALVTLFTSGTTGAPRPYVKTAAQILGEADMLGRGPCAGTSRVLATVPPIHIYGLLFGVAVPLLHGGAFIRETPLHAPTVAAMVDRFRADALVSVPAHLRGLELLPEGTLSRALRVYSSGAALPETVGEMLHRRFGFRVTEVLGSSETGGIASRDRAGDAWRPLPGVRVSAAADGQMLLDSPFAPADAERPWPCADRVAMNADGSFQHLGRRDQVVKVASKRVDLDAMQRALLGLPGVVDAAVIADEIDGARGAQISAAVVAPTWSPRGLREALGAHFDRVVLPRPIVCVDRLPREASGKLRGDRLREIIRAGGTGATAGQDGGVLSTRRAFDARPVNGRPGAYEIHVPEDLEYFRGHFDGHPILPGVVQLELLVARQIALTWPELTRAGRITRLRFRAPVRPGDSLILELARPEPDRVEFEIQLRGKTCSSGSLHFTA